MDGFVKGKVPAKLKAVVYLILVGALFAAWAMTSSTTWAQQPRPTLTPQPDASEPGTGAQTAPFSYSGPILKGRVINVVTGDPESGVKVVFATGGVSVEVESNGDGEYAFEHLGTANGVLNAVPSRGSGLRSLTADVAVRPKVGVETVVNLGVSTNGSGAPPLIPDVKVSPDYVGAGEMMTITVVVKNTLPEAITDATITNWLPARLVPVDIRSNTGNPYFSDNLAVAELGRLDTGGGAQIEIIAQAAGGGMSTSAAQGNVSFYYRESSAAQAQSFGQTNGAAPVVLPITGVGLPVIGLVLIIVVILVGLLRRRVGNTLRAG